jgi:hypothetical protein
MVATLATVNAHDLARDLRKSLGVFAIPVEVRGSGPDKQVQPWVEWRELYDSPLGDADFERVWRGREDAPGLAMLLGPKPGFLALDADNAEAEAEWITRLPRTVAWRSTRGPKWLFRWPTGNGAIPSGSNVLGPGRDVLGDHHIVVLPPTQGRDWLPSQGPEDAPVAWLPEAELRRLQAAERPKTPAGEVPEFIPEGSRETHLVSMAGTMRRRGFSAPGILAALRVENDARCMPPLVDADLERIAASVGRYEPAENTAVEAEPPSHVESAGTPWPELDPEALQGLAGDFVRAVEPYSEADPAALLGSLLVMFGNAVGDGPHAVAESDRHPARLNIVVVGETSRSRKGTSYSRALDVLSRVDPGWAAGCVASGLSSGEGLIAAVRDGADEDDPGVLDKRLFVFEPEFARVLAVAGREGNIVSTVLRAAWDDGRLRVMTRKDPLRATGAHISVLAHVTAAELTRRLSDTEMANGFANRFMYPLARRSKLLPRGESFPEDKLNQLVRRLHETLAAARRIGRMHRTEEAEEFWDAIYRRLADGPEGLVGAVTARAQAQVLRLSVAYALLDASPEITGQHVLSAHAVWDYAEQSAVRIFGDATGDPVADRLLEAIREAGLVGLDFEAQRNVFSRNRSAEELASARALLERVGRIRTVVEETGGRPRSVSHATRKARYTRKGPP